MQKENNLSTVIEFDATTILSLNYIKNYLRIDNDCDDEFLQNALLTAISYAEKITGYILGVKTLKTTITLQTSTQKLKEFPFIINEIISITNNGENLQDTDYTVNNGVILFKHQISGTLEIEFKTGMESLSVPQDIKQAILQHIATMYQNKNGNYTIPQAVQNTYSQYKNIRI